jgi:CheY-like chemotaxis protein
MSEAHDQAMDAGVNQFVTKPVHLSRLQEAIQVHLAPQPEPTRFSVL